MTGAGAIGRALALVVAIGGGPALADPGKDAFDSQCASCHPIKGPSTVNGPTMKGVVWRRIASRSDFRYSAQLKAQIGTWSPGRLDAYLRDSQAFAPGTDMFWRVGDPAVRRSIVRYLETLR